MALIKKLSETDSVKIKITCLTKCLAIIYRLFHEHQLFVKYWQKSLQNTYMNFLYLELKR